MKYNNYILLGNCFYCTARFDTGSDAAQRYDCKPHRNSGAAI